MEYKQLQMYPSKNIIYYVKWSNEYKNYFLEPYQDKFPIPDKIYGDIEKIAYKVWNEYVIRKKSTGILLTGAPGGGKSLTISLISNLALKAGMAVIMLQKVKIDNNLIHWLSTLTNVVLFLDEFGKMINRTDQEQMLTMFSDINGSKKIYLLTENKIHQVSEFILNRPGRVRYHVNFDKIDKKTLEDYCADHNVDKAFYRDLEQKYKISSKFTFDHLQCVISEHLKYPQEKFTDLIQWLNLDIFKQKEVYFVESCIYLKNPELNLEFSAVGDEITADNLDIGPRRAENCGVKITGVKIGDNVERLGDHIPEFSGSEYWWYSFNKDTKFNDDSSINIKDDKFEIVLRLKSEKETMWGGYYE